MIDTTLAPLHTGSPVPPLQLFGVLTLSGAALLLSLWLSTRVDLGRFAGAVSDVSRGTAIVSVLAVAMLAKIGLVGVGFFVTGYVTPVVLLLGVLGGVVIWGVVVPNV